MLSLSLGMQDASDRIGKLTIGGIRARVGSDARAKDEQGLGRSIPIIEGVLVKTTSGGSGRKGRARRWVTLTPGSLTYYSSTQAYMSNLPGKAIQLKVVDY